MDFGQFDRKNWSKPVADRYLIITNGFVTEAEYFNRIKQLSYDFVDVKTRGRGYSLEDMLNDAVEARNGSIYDNICIVIDIDDYLRRKGNRRKIETFLINAQNVGIQVYLSNECFEVWLCAHKTQLSLKMAKRSSAIKLAHDLGMTGGRNNKHIVPDSINPNTINFAIKEAARHRKINKIKDVLRYSPSTDVDILVGAIRLK